MSASKPLLPQQLGDAHIRLLRIYRVVVESSGFAAAEIELNISRPAISMAIGELESLLQMRLCHRGRGGFSLTEEGSQVYDAALQLFAGLETFRSQIHAINTELKGELNIGITDNLVTMPQMRITRALAGLKQRGPGITVHIRMIPPNDIETGVLDGTLHTGVVPELRRLPGLNYIELYQEELCLYCSAEHTLFDADTEALSDAELAEFDAVLPAYRQSAAIKQQQQQLRLAATSTDREGIAFLILTGKYIGYLPTHLAERWVEQGRLRAIAPARRRLVNGYCAVTRKGARPNPNIDAYLQALLEQDG